MPVVTHSPAERLRDLTSSAIRDILAVTRRPGVLSLAGGLPATTGLPLARLQAVADGLVADDLQYAPTEGLEELRAWIAGRLRAMGRDLGPDDVLVTSGSQQALALVATAWVDPGDRVAIDAPGYLGAIQALTPSQPAFDAIVVDRHGMQVDRVGSQHRLAYTVTESSNPSGSTLADDRRQHLGATSAQTGVIVVEDRAYDGLAFGGQWARPRPSIGAEGGHVLTLGSLSKVLAPGLRIGWVAGPPHLLEPIRRAKQAADLQASTLTQRLAVDLLADTRWFTEHVAGVVAHLSDNAAALVQALERHLPGRVEVAAPTGGMFAWARVPDVDTTAWLQRAVTHDVAFVPGPAFGATAEARAGLVHHLRLSYATLDPDSIDEAVRRLAASL